MSFDRWWVCRTADRSTWTERRGAEQNGRLVEFEHELARLEEQGHLVVLSHGSNVLLDELYAFEREADALAFYEEGYKRREFMSNMRGHGFPERGGGFGFQEASLYIAGVRRASKSENPEPVVEQAYEPQEGVESQSG